MLTPKNAVYQRGLFQSTRTPDMILPPFVRATPEGVIISLKVQPRASKDEFGEVRGNELKVKVTAPPVDSAANEAVLRLLADRLDCPRNRIALMRGGTSRHKTILLHGLSPETVLARLLTPSV